MTFYQAVHTCEEKNSNNKTFFVLEFIYLDTVPYFGGNGQHKKQTNIKNYLAPVQKYHATTYLAF